jgi:hypothetical protein
MAARTGTGANRLATIAACETHQASRLVRGLRSQSRVLASVSVLTPIYPAQHEAAPLSPERSA